MNHDTKAVALDKKQLLVIEYAKEAVEMILRDTPRFNSCILSCDDSGSYKAVFEVEAVMLQESMTVTFPRQVTVRMRLNGVKNFQPYQEVLVDAGKNNAGNDIVVSLLYLGGKFIAYEDDLEVLRSIYKMPLAA